MSDGIFINMQMRKHIDMVWYILKYTYGIVPIIAGADKFLNILVHWDQYLMVWGPHLPVETTQCMHIIGIIEICAGLLVLSPYTRLGAYVVMCWLLGIAGMLIGQGMHYDVAVRDVVIAIGAFTLAQVDMLKNMLGKR